MNRKIFMLPVLLSVVCLAPVVSLGQATHHRSSATHLSKRKIALARGSESYALMLNSATRIHQHLTVVSNRSIARYQVKVRKSRGVTQLSLYCGKTHRYINRVTVRHPRSLQASSLAMNRAMTTLVSPVNTEGTQDDEVNDPNNEQIPDDNTTTDPGSGGDNQGSGTQGGNTEGSTTTTDDNSSTTGNQTSTGTASGGGTSGTEGGSESSGQGTDGNTGGSSSGGDEGTGTDTSLGRVRLRLSDVYGLRGDRVEIKAVAKDASGQALANTRLSLKVGWPHESGRIHTSLSAITDARGIAHFRYVIPRLVSADNIYLHVTATGGSGEAVRRIHIGARH